MQYTPDILSEWPALGDEPFAGIAALFVADRDMDGDAFRVISEGVAEGRYFGLFVSADSDSALRRKLAFWTRHPDAAALGETAECSQTVDGRISRVALLELTDSGLVRDACTASRSRRVACARDAL